jgi:transcriptional regulator GlxA family with amidase domain
MLLAEAGLLRGRPATTHHSTLDQLPAYGAHLIDARVVDDGDLITSAGVTAGLDLALWLVEREAGPQIAEEVATEIERDRIGQVALGPSASAARTVDPRLVLDQSRKMPITP